jgi:hypothetical protein
LVSRSQAEHGSKWAAVVSVAQKMGCAAQTLQRGVFRGGRRWRKRGLSVRKIRDVLRLKNETRLSDRQIGAVLRSARSTVQEGLKRARLAGLSWPLPAELDEE